MILDILQVDFITTIINAIIVVISIIVYRYLKRTTVELKGRTALITGGASGIGLATAKAFADIGMNIVVWDKNVKKMEDSREEITKHLQKGYYLIQQRVDISNIFQIQEGYEQLKKQLSQINQKDVSIIVNNAGIVYKHGLLDMDIKDTQDIFAVNTIGSFAVVHTFLPDLINQGVSNIVNISSLISCIPSSNLSSYSASKAATLAMTNCLRVELKTTNNDHIRVTSICPQFVNTGMFKGCCSNNYLGHRIKNMIFPENSPEDIANEIIYAIRHEKDEVILPRVMKPLISLLSLFPHVITDYVFMFFGGAHGMDTFEGRGKEWNQCDSTNDTLVASANENTVLCCNTNSF